MYYSYWKWLLFLAINETVKQVEAAGGMCKGYLVDISKKEEVYKAADLIRRDVGNVSYYTISPKYFM